MKLITGLRLAPALLLLGAWAGPSVAQTTWYADVNGTPPGTGTLADPYTSIDYALHQATTVSGDTILVAPGTYYETIRYYGKAVAVKSSLDFGGELVTFIDAQHLGSVVTMMGGHGDGPMLLRGFTLLNGVGTERAGLMSGGAVFAVECEAYIERCVLADSTAVLGAGLYGHAAKLTLDDVGIRDNVAETQLDLKDGQGGGVYLHDCELTATFTGVHHNVAGRGGGIYATGSDLAISDSNLYGNEAWVRDFQHKVAQGGGLWANAGTLDMFRTGVYQNLVYGPETAGGGLFLVGVNPAHMLQVDVHDNQVGLLLPFDVVASGWGGGIASRGGVLGVGDSRIVGNVAPTAGGGVYGAGTYNGVILSGNTADYGGGACGPHLIHCQVFDNTALWGGGAAFSRVDLSTFYANQAIAGGGAYYLGSAWPVGPAPLLTVQPIGPMAPAAGALFTGRLAVRIANSILWENGPAPILDQTGRLVVRYSDVQGGYPGVGVHDAEPMFWDAAARDFHLLVESPCIDTGDPTLHDPDGTRCDMGALPFDPTYGG